MKQHLDVLRSVAKPDGEYWQQKPIKDAAAWAVDEIIGLNGAVDELQKLVKSQADRIAAQSDLLSKKAEAVHGQQTA